MARPFRAVIFGRYSVFTTWILWNQLLHPTAHPLFRRIDKSSKITAHMPCMMWLVLAAGMLVCYGSWRLLIQFKAPIVGPLLMAIIFLSSNVYIIVWIIAISITIAREHENGTYDQLCVSPPGALGANRAICTACLHRNDALNWINLLRKLITGLVLFVFLMVLMVAASSQRIFNMSQFLRPFLDITVLTAASYIDHVQAIVLGCLVGMLVPTYSRNSLDAPVLAIGVFLTLQAIILFTNLLAITVVLPALYAVPPVTGWWAEISPPLLNLLVFYLIREAFNNGLWRALAYRLNASSVEFS